MSCQRTPSEPPSALISASLAANRAASECTGSAALGLGEQALAQARRALDRPGEPLQVDDVDPDTGDHDCRASATRP